MGDNVPTLMASIASAVPELNVALANINIDFTAYKAPPPVEYHGVGQALSKRRRTAAEDGHDHIVARKLWRLFYKFLPDVPTLIRAYGQRASEIASRANASSRNSGVFSLFADFEGADATTIWAAATSSHDAICLHLLACMLARVWKPPQAIAIWVELVEGRQLELTGLDRNDPMHVSDIAAARLELSRDDLANWDASARAWLSLADEAMKKQQVQFLLLVDKTKLPIDVQLDTYKSVTKVWKSALTHVEKVLNGTSYRVSEGSLLLGLASWHLFPDMNVISEGGDKYVRQNDGLVRSAGCLTFGLEGQISDDDADGIYWSLPLAHLRYYGDPVQVKGAMGTSSLRLSQKEFALSIFGSFIGRWAVKHSQDVRIAAGLFDAIWQFLSVSAESEHTLQPDRAQIDAMPFEIASFIKADTWFKMLATAAEDLLLSNDEQARRKEDFVAMGSRRLREFLAPIKNTVDDPILGIDSLETLLSIMRPSAIVPYLRELVDSRNELKSAGSDLLIRYRHCGPLIPDLSPIDVSARDSNTSHRSTPGLWKKFIATTSSFIESPNSAAEVSHSPSQQGVADNQSDCEPIGATKRAPPRDSREPETKRQKTLDPTIGDPSRKYLWEFDAFASAVPEIVSSSASSASSQPFNHWARYIEESFELSDSDFGEESVSRFPFFELHSDNTGTAFSWGTEIYSSGQSLPSAVNRELWASVYGDRFFSFQTATNYQYLLGDKTVGAVLCANEAIKSPMPFELTVKDISNAFQRGYINPYAFLRRLSSLTRTKPDEEENQLDEEENQREENETPHLLLFQSLRALSAAEKLYQLMPGATIPTTIFAAQMAAAKWVPTFHSGDPQSYQKSLKASKLDRRSTFACIAMFENSSINVDPKGLEEVMALSAGNSIYVTMPLLCDPSDEPQECEMKRIMGNIGQAGITFLIPPPSPLVRKEMDSWKLINHAAFDGRLMNQFQSTSLHLSFTKFCAPVGERTRGAQDTEAYFRETLVRLYGDGKWVADLSILQALESRYFRRLRPVCKHSGVLRNKKTPAFQVKCIDNWSEFLDRPRLPGIVRTNGDWYERLAAVTLNVQLGYPTILFPPQQRSSSSSSSMCTSSPEDTVSSACLEGLCWRCASEALGLEQYDPAAIPYFIA